MYESFYQLQRRPFETGNDLAAYYPSDAHQAALLRLRYVIETAGGAAVLAGISGTGKTLLVRLLLERLSDTFTPRVHLVFPDMPSAELLSLLAHHLDGRSVSGPIDQSVQRIEDCLRHHAAQGRHAVVVIDEAQLIDQLRTYETLRLLLNFEHEGRPMLTLLLVGQPSLLPQLERLGPLSDRLAARCLLRPLTFDETLGYVTHWLSIAGAARPIFTSSALEAIHHHTQGIPRRIHRLCDFALLMGYADELSTIDARQIEVVAEELAAPTA